MYSRTNVTWWRSHEPWLGQKIGIPLFASPSRRFYLNFRGRVYDFGESLFTPQTRIRHLGNFRIRELFRVIQNRVRGISYGFLPAKVLKTRALVEGESTWRRRPTSR
jgi:hypothetical protein